MTSCVENPVIVLVGPTAIGKTALSLEIAEKISCEIVSVDSMQVYRHMDIGTAKILPEEMRGIPHHLIDVVAPDEPYDAASFARDALNKIKEIHTRGKIPLLTGGTGLYLRALLVGIFDEPESNADLRDKLRARLEAEGRSKIHAELAEIDPLSAARIHENDTHRLLRALEVYFLTGKTWTDHINSQKRDASQVQFKRILKIGLTTERKQLYERINLRSRQMFDNGLEEEVRWLLNQGFDANLKSMNSIGYRHAVNMISGVWDKARALELLARDTRRYAKRQYTWFSADDEILWFDVARPQMVVEMIDKWISIHKNNNNEIT